MDPKFSPCNDGNDDLLVSYVSQGDIYVQQVYGTHIRQKRLTFANSGDPTGKVKKTAGIAEFIMQEEFDRFTGYWWCPKKIGQKYRIAFLEVDESEIPIVKIPISGSLSADVDEYSYPRPGENNAKSTLCLVEFDDKLEQSQVIRFDEIFTKDFPWVEYIGRVGWTADGTRIWLQMLDRSQQRQAIITFNPDSNDIEIVHAENTNIWINVFDMTHFLKGDRVILSSEVLGDGFNHLFLFERDATTKSYKQVKQLTKGDWVVQNTFVDEENEIVYFTGTMDSALETHLYRVQYGSNAISNDIYRITEKGYSYSGFVANGNFSQFVCSKSSLSEQPSVVIYSVVADSINHKLSSSTTIFSTPSLDDSISDILSKPKIFSFKNKHGDVIYGCAYLPNQYDSSKKYPTILYIYGGPHVQLIANRYSLYLSSRLQLLAYLGYIVVVIDGRGSYHRGLKFEGILREKMGQVELEDYIEGLIYLMNSKGEDSTVINIDPSRIGVFGWSYGGYMSLMCLGQRPDVFKVAVSGAPVTMWELYDTGYTERYMDTPQKNPKGYEYGSVLHYVENFPDEPNRLLVVHGLSDENVHFKHTEVLVQKFIEFNKPYQLAIYPGERHGIRSPLGNTHFMVTMITFFHNNLRI